MQGRRLDPDKLRDLRIDRGLSVETLAEQAGISRSFAYALESGERQPGLDVALRLAKALRCSRHGGIKAFMVKDAAAEITTQQVADHLARHTAMCEEAG